MRSKIRVLGFIVLWAAIAPSDASSAADLIFEPEISVEFDDNIFASADDEFTDIIYRGRPRVSIKDEDGSFQFGFRYEPGFEAFARADGISNWEHSLRWTGEWRVGPRTRLSFDDRFDRLTSAGRFNETSTGADTRPATEEVFGRRRYKRNSANLVLEHQLRPNHFVALNVDHFYQDYGTLSSGTVESVGGGVSYSYALSATDRFGLGVSFTRQEFEDFGFQEDSETDFYYVYGSWTHEFDPTLTMSISAGPTLIDADIPSSFPTSFPNQLLNPVLQEGTNFRLADLSSCDVENGFRILSGCSPTGPLLSEAQVGLIPRVTLPLQGSISDPDDTDVTFFASGELTKRWGTWTTGITYRRQASASSQFGTSTVSDTVRATATWMPSPRWQVNLIGIYFNREQSSDSQILVTSLGPSGLAPPFDGSAAAVGVVAVETDRAVDTDQWQLHTVVNYRWNRRLTVFGRVFYVEEEEDGDIQAGRDTERFRAFVGVRYTFDRIHLY